MELEQLAKAAPTDQAAALALFQLLRGHLTRYLVGMGLSDEDLVQQTLAAVLHRLPTFEDRGRGSFLRWVHGILRFEVANQRRHHGRRSRVALALACGVRTPPTTVTSYVAQQERLQVVVEEMGELTSAHRRAIELCLAGGDARELAASEGISVPAARMLKSRAKERLRHLVGLRFVHARPKFVVLRRRKPVRSRRRSGPGASDSSRSPQASPT